MATEYNTFDLNVIMKKNAKVISSEEALKDVNPVEWSEDILQGKEKVVIKKKKE